MNIFEQAALPRDTARQLEHDFNREFRPPQYLDEPCPDCGQKRLHCSGHRNDDE